MITQSAIVKSTRIFKHALTDFECYVVSIMHSVMIIMLLCVQRMNLRALHLRLVSLDKIKRL